MLVDLGRNDVGRVSKAGTVVVKDKMIVAEILARDTHRQFGGWETKDRGSAHRSALLLLSGRHGIRRAEDPSDGDYRRTGAP